MKQTDIITTTYEHGDFLVDIVFHPGSGLREAWISKKEFGIKSLMFAMQKEEDLFLEIVSVNLEEYEDGYEEDYGG